MGAGYRLVLEALGILAREPDLADARAPLAWSSPGSARKGLALLREMERELARSRDASIPAAGQRFVFVEWMGFSPPECANRPEHARDARLGGCRPTDPRARSLPARNCSRGADRLPKSSAASSSKGPHLAQSTAVHSLL